MKSKDYTSKPIREGYCLVGENIFRRGCISLRTVHEDGMETVAATIVPHGDHFFEKVRNGDRITIIINKSEEGQQDKPYYGGPKGEGL